VSKLPKGTIAALQSAERGRYKGTVKTLPGESSWRSQVPRIMLLHLPLSFVKPGQWQLQLDTRRWLHEQGRMTRSDTCCCRIFNLLAACQLVVTDMYATSSVVSRLIACHSRLSVPDMILTFQSLTFKFASLPGRHSRQNLVQQASNNRGRCGADGYLQAC